MLALLWPLAVIISIEKNSEWNVGFLFFFRLIIVQNYFGDPWNVLDFIIVLGSIADIVYTELSVSLNLCIRTKCEYNDKCKNIIIYK